MTYFKSMIRLSAPLLLLTLANCGTMDRLSNIGRAPELSPIETQQREVSRGERVTVPMPRADAPQYSSNSLWRSGARTFFKDQRASMVGDLVTVLINIADKANIANTTSRSRSAGEDAGLDNFLGLESQLGRVLPDEVDPGSLVKGDSSSSHTGEGSVDRKEDINLTVAAIVTKILPNGNMVIRGRQEVRVNFEVRELFVAGIVRPEDISATNTIRHSQIAEARIAYGGRGQLTDVQQPRYGQQFFDIVFPF